jgi:hypothetical protein
MNILLNLRGSKKRCSSVAAQLVACREGLSSVELLSHIELTVEHLHVGLRVHTGCAVIYDLYDVLFRWGQIRDVINHVKFEVFTVVTMKNGVFWDVTPCGSCKNRRFGGT